MREPLLFFGMRWPAARIVARKQVVDDDPNRSEKTVSFVDTLIIETTGQGRPYSVDCAEGWWRDLAETPLDDEKRVLSFLRRRGDPLGQLAPDGTQISTRTWRDLKRVLQSAASAWQRQPHATGISRFRPEKLRGAENMFEMATGRAATGWASELEVFYGHGITPTHRAKTLAAYLCCAATASVRGGLDMRRCDYCHSWFILHYATARHCSNSCRAAFNNRRSPRAILPQDQNT
jgi:hypothetical protein